MQTQSVIRIQGLSKSYGEKLILDQLDMDVQAGAIHGILGPNGVGKTTLFNTIFYERGHDQIQVTGTICYNESEPYFYDYMTGRKLLTLTSNSNVATIDN